MNELENAKDILCEKCGSPYFKKVMRIKKLSKLLTQSGDDEYIPIPITACADCGHVNKEFDLE